MLCTQTTKAGAGATVPTHTHHTYSLCSHVKGTSQLFCTLVLIIGSTVVPQTTLRPFSHLRLSHKYIPFGYNLELGSLSQPITPIQCMLVEKPIMDLVNFPVITSSNLLWEGFSLNFKIVFVHSATAGRMRQ